MKEIKFRKSVVMVLCISLLLSIIPDVLCYNVYADNYKDVYVITRVKGQFYDFGYGGMLPTGETAYKYNKRGLVTHEAVEYYGKFSDQPTYTYDKDNKIKTVYDTKFFYDKEGKRKKTVLYDEDEDTTREDKFGYNKNNQVSKIVGRYYNDVEKKEEKYIWLLEYDKNNRVTKYIRHKDERVAPYYHVLNYDDNGNIKEYATYGRKLVNGTPVTSGEKFLNEYNNNLLTKRTRTGWNSLQTDPTDIHSAEYIYKKIRVPKSMVNLIKQQQWSIINYNLNFALKDHAGSLV